MMSEFALNPISNNKAASRNQLTSKNRVSAPAPGRSLGAAVNRIEPPIRNSVRLLSTVIALDDEITAEILGRSVYGPGATREPDGLRLSWFVVSVAIGHAIVMERSKVGPFHDALEWFFGNANTARQLMSCFPQHQILRAEEELSALSVTEELYELLPYVLEPHGHVSRSRLEACDHAKSNRDAKRGAGVYYTPSDVADFMVSTLAAMPGHRQTWIDPACGTGVFLRAIVTHYRKIARRNSSPNLHEYALRNVYGIDKSALATDLAAFVLFVECSTQNHYEGMPFEFWTRIKRNLVCMDALRLSPRTFMPDLYSDTTRQSGIHEVFPGIGNSGFDHVVMNPPYASDKIDQALQLTWSSLSDVSPGQSGDLQLAFTEMLWRLTNDAGVSSAVLPLSIGTNTTRSYKRLRQLLLSSEGVKEFLFFDREPQALFGEDIKTRNLILIRYRDEQSHSIKTSRLLKWTAEQRPTIFTRDRLVRVPADLCVPFIPKIGTETEMNAYACMRAPNAIRHAALCAPQVGRMSIEQALKTTSERQSGILLISGTAYNFINVFFASALPKNPPTPYSNSPLNFLQLASQDEAYAAYALLSSRLCFWLWHAEGDGFHLTADFLRRLPFWAPWSTDAVRERLAARGKELWEMARGSMVGAVNGGKQTYSFHSGHDHPAAKAVENELLNILGIDEQFSDAIDAFIESTISIDGKRRLRRTGSST